jgi:NAD(P)-dependent dehydrogenase (short-subunit alcohol dehydrogenase family)
MTLRLSPIGQLDLTSGKLGVIGGTNGLGRAIAKQALARGAEVTVVGRTFRDAPATRLTFVAADLSSMSEAARVGRELPAESFDVVLFTTGIIAAKTREETPEHIERDMAVSYLSRLAILQGLSSRLGTARKPGAPRPRVFIMGSPGVGTLGDPADLNSELNYRPGVTVLT